MKKYFAVLAFAFFVLPCFSQGKIEGGFYAEHYQLGDKGQQQFGGILHLPIGERFTLNYQLGIGPQNGGGIYVHCPAGAIASGWLLTHGGNIEFLNYLGILMICMPEGGGMYFGKGKIVSHASINPFGVDYWYHGFPHEEKAKMGCNFVYRAKMRSTLKWPIYLAPQVSATWIYTPVSVANFGFRVGVTIGFEAKDAPDEPIMDRVIDDAGQR